MSRRELKLLQEYYKLLVLMPAPSRTTLDPDHFDNVRIIAQELMTVCDDLQEALKPR